MNGKLRIVTICIMAFIFVSGYYLAKTSEGSRVEYNNSAQAACGLTSTVSIHVDANKRVTAIISGSPGQQCAWQGMKGKLLLYKSGTWETVKEGRTTQQRWEYSHDGSDYSYAELRNTTKDQPRHRAHTCYCSVSGPL